MMNTRSAAVRVGTFFFFLKENSDPCCWQRRRAAAASAAAAAAAAAESNISSISGGSSSSSSSSSSSNREYISHGARRLPLVYKHAGPETFKTHVTERGYETLDAQPTQHKRTTDINGQQLQQQQNKMKSTASSGNAAAQQQHSDSNLHTWYAYTEHTYNARRSDPDPHASCVR